MRAVPQSADVSLLSRHRGLWLRSTAATAELAHCDVRFGPIEDESSVAEYADCLFDRSGGEFSLSSTGGGTAIERCAVTGNGGGDGIRAGLKTLVDCTATLCVGTGLAGGALIDCEASGNGTGMSGTTVNGALAVDNAEIGILAAGSVASAEARGNGGDGIVAGGGVSDSLAVENAGTGIAAGGDVVASRAIGNQGGIDADGDVSDSLAEGNGGAGIIAGGEVSGSSAIANGSIGITASLIVDSASVGNGTGLGAGGSLLRSAVAENTGFGVTGGSVSASAVHHNLGGGVTGASAVANSWLVGNGGDGVANTGSIVRSLVASNEAVGIAGRTGAPATSVMNSTVRGNLGSGIRRAGPVNASNLLDNGALDYEETRLSTSLLEADLAGNFWGAATTALMASHPWGTNFDIPRIHDFYDDTELAFARYEGFEPAFLSGSLPDDQAPAFLIGVSPDESEPAAGLTPFRLAFSRPMDTGADPAVTFDALAPFTRHVVQPSPGWVSSTAWWGEFPITSGLATGEQTIRLSGAVDALGRPLPDDTAHRFVIGPGRLLANNGVATTTGSRSVSIEWDHHCDVGGPPCNTALVGGSEFDLSGAGSDPVIGYQVLRIRRFLELTNITMNGPITDNSIEDTGLEPETTYLYEIHIRRQGGGDELWVSAQHPSMEASTFGEQPHGLLLR